jgi:hypothetical protein
LSDTDELELTNSESESESSQSDIITELEYRLHNALISIDQYQDERFELLDKIIELKLRLQNVVDILEK